MIITRYCAIKPPIAAINGSIVARQDAGEASEFLKSVYRYLHVQYPKFYKMDPLCKLAFLSTEILLNDADLASRYSPGEIGMIIQNFSSSLETDEKHMESIGDRANYFPSPSVFVYTLPNIMTGEIAIRHKIKGENAVFISEKPDPSFIFRIVSELFNNDRIRCCITGWIEAYHDRLSSCLMLVENEEKAESSSIPEEMLIFDPLIIEQIFKEELQDGRTDIKA